jgi:Uma2 family endonuclease
VATQVALLSFDQFMDLPDQEGLRRELDEGALIEMPNASFVHGSAITTLARLVGNDIERLGLDLRMSTNVAFRLGPDTVRAPDLCLIRAPKLQAMTVERGVLLGCPDLAAEVVSPSETALDLNRKIEQYLAAGAVAVWVLYTDSRTMMVYRHNGEVWRLSGAQILQEPELLPGLALPIDKIVPPPR